MPTYEYECSSCGHRFEIFQKITAIPLQECPRCGLKLRRLIGSGGGIIFKGPGFYATDYRSQAYRKREKEENTSTPSSVSQTKESCTEKKKSDEKTS